MPPQESTIATGSWFPTGYYGHHRSKPRHDLYQEFRRSARPIPPKRFIKWVRKSPDLHNFSNHDNKHSFPTDASYFDTGLGRRRGEEKFTMFRPDLIHWMPHAKELRGVIPASSYRSDFGPGAKAISGNITQCISPRVRAQSSKPYIEMSKKNFPEYRRNFTHGQPNPAFNTNFSTGYNRVDANVHHPTHEMLNTTGRINRPKDEPLIIQNKSARRARTAPVRYSVGDCLVWDLGHGRKVKAATPGAAVSESLPNMTPAATQISAFHPPHPPPKNLAPHPPPSVAVA